MRELYGALALLLFVFKLNAALLDCSKNNSSYLREISRVCTIFNNSAPLQISATRPGCGVQQSEICEAHAGMSVRVDCHQEIGIDTQRVEIVRNNHVLSNSTSLMINFASLADSGQYQCRTYFRGEMEPYTVPFNISVSTGLS